MGYQINQNGVKPIQDKTEAITKLKAPTNTKITFGIKTTLVKISEQPVQKDRENEKITKERRKMGIDERNKW